VVDDTEATKKRHVDGHVVLSDRVHGRRQKRYLQNDSFRNRRVKSDIRSREAYRAVNTETTNDSAGDESHQCS
jgi:hypothetical protein